MCYFNPEVWGTVSDWTMVGVTSLTAYYLYKTLKSQKNVQKTQNKLFEIEKIRFKESIKPSLIYTQSKREFESGKYFKIVSIEISNESESSAEDIEIEYEKRGNISRIMVGVDFLPVPQNHLKRGDRPYFLSFLIAEEPIAVEFITFRIQFKDISGTVYRQNVACIYEDSLLNIISGKAESI